MPQEPILALSRFFYICAALMIPVAWGAYVLYRRHCDRAYDSAPEATPEEIIEELEREFSPPQPRTTIRTQAEYLPLLFEFIRQNIDSGFEDPHMISLLQRIENHRPGDERTATFTVVSGRRPTDLHLRWVRDSCDRILIRIQGSPRLIRALRDYKHRIPKAALA